MQHRNNKMLLHIAIGDAVAAAVEYVNPYRHQCLIEETLRLEGYHQHPTHLKLKPGMYTDDTQMSIGTAEVVIELKKFLPFNLSDRSAFSILISRLSQDELKFLFIQAWVRVFQRDWRDGYAKGFQLFLEATKSAEEFREKIHPDSNKNGGCMRAVPVGVIRDIEVMLAVASAQAQTTHNTPIGIFSSQAVALMSHFALYRYESFDDLYEYLYSYLGNKMDLLNLDLHRRWQGEVKNPATNTIHAVYDLLVHNNTLSEVLRGAITFGGDTDSVAAIALGIASARMKDDLPQVLYDNLKNGPYGRDYLLSLGTQLMDTYA